MAANNPVAFPLLLAVISAVVVGIRWHSTPTKLPIWWNLQANPIAWVPRWFGLVILPVLQLLVPYVLYQLATRDQFLEGQSGESANALANIIALPAVFLFAVLHLVYIDAATSSDHKFSPRIFTTNIAIWLLVWLGYNFQYIEPNSSIGVAAFWTVSHQRLWKEIHWRSARLLIGTGTLLFILALVIPLGLVFLVVTLVLWLGVYVVVCVDCYIRLGSYSSDSSEGTEPMLEEQP